MAEEIVDNTIEKNQPSTEGAYGDPNPGLYQGQGAVANLGIGGVPGGPGGDAWGTPGVLIQPTWELPQAQTPLIQ